MKAHTPLPKDLRWRISATRRLWSRRTASIQSLATQSALPNGPVGFIDPPPQERLERASATIKGWVLFPEAATDRVEVFLNETPLGRCRLAVGRADVAAEIDHPLAPISGFELNVDLSGLDGLDGAVAITAEARSVDGDLFRPEPLRVTLAEQPPSKPKVTTPSPVAMEPEGVEPRVLVFTHQLGLGGAQLYLLDLLSEMTRTEAASFVVVSTLDGPVREKLEEIGIPVHLTSPFPLDDLGQHLGRIDELTGWTAPRGFDAVFINTATTLSSFGAEIAEHLDLPVVWAVHESFPPTQLFRDMIPEVRRELDRALQRSSFLVFEAEATKRLFEPIAGSAQCVTLPYGLDLEPIDATRSGFDRVAARRKNGVPEDARAIVCIGTVEPRKAQIMLAQAFDQVAARHPSAHLYFVGGRDDGDSEALSGYIRLSPNRERMRLVPITPDVQPWYGMADFLVCASDIESLPRTVLEAMAWETPVLATDVFGLPELITPDETGWLCEPRSLKALAQALDDLLDTPRETCERIASQARTLVEERHSLPEYSEHITKLLREAILASEEDKRRIESG